MKQTNNVWSAGIEDEDNWHGKALGDKSTNVVKALKEKMSNKGPHGLTPNPPEVKASVANVSNIKLSEAPKYSMGQQVYHYFTLLQLISVSNNIL